ncbi:glucose-6-phosphate 1-dehydrogenase [Mycolicibacterium mageritense DSM 44476 = CIP 104973]|uniref:Glucose-6-phosphate 1-dehydrogenase n=1 Tax=Mycolicibacterium mageritense TaxID=53462 RepID=A0ABM7HQ10_MYCME|nr:glucose-6-phosphate dehydrogenase [Mycolicibacterium mageritense]MCC9180237.1 glucose-6-phosphate dehydrogenase [Mycolicibacterium mageritense]BBX32620.1 glucose-6-phosphate 1-dehydrogenase [Mycolicibacterium mageritense]CDO22839.1 glucose-6-phosphate 1-dehydrogenase [Mycolicibacterium mageritense DSM 44476 = CIP 104973]
MRTPRPVDPCDFVIFGGTGDLAVRKLLPALYLRDRDGQLTEGTRIIGVAKAGLDEPGYRDKIQAELARFVPAELLDAEIVERFLARLRFVSIDLTEPSDYAAVADLLASSTVEIRVFYLACAPALFGPICAALGAHNLATETSRVVLEKPIGRDLASAREINDAVGSVFDEHQIFRIDHYLGKESVQNLLVTRFANTLLEPLWNSSRIDHVQITAAESLGVGSRGDYYDRSGALRDMLQNHLLQVLCLVAMEPPTHVNRESVRDEKRKVLQALAPLSADDIKRDTVTGQYGPGLVNGEVVGSYCQDCENPDSRTETFVAVKAEVRNWRWAGVPFYLRTGKRMSQRFSEIVVQFKPVPLPMFPGIEGASEPNRLIISLQPDEEIRLEMTAKEPGSGGRLRPVSLALNYTEAFQDRSPDAYERLLMDVVRGDPTLFMRRDEVEAAWAWAEPILHHWHDSGRVPRTYPAGTDGPVDAATLIERDGRRWHEGAA